MPFGPEIDADLELYRPWQGIARPRRLPPPKSDAVAPRMREEPGHGWSERHPVPPPPTTSRPPHRIVRAARGQGGPENMDERDALEKSEGKSPVKILLVAENCSPPQGRGGHPPYHYFRLLKRAGTRSSSSCKNGPRASWKATSPSCPRITTSRTTRRKGILEDRCLCQRVAEVTSSIGSTSHELAHAFPRNALVREHAIQIDHQAARSPKQPSYMHGWRPVVIGPLTAA
jgi:hypothetical protein